MHYIYIYSYAYSFIIKYRFIVNFCLEKKSVLSYKIFYLQARNIGPLVLKLLFGPNSNIPNNLRKLQSV